MAEVGQGNDMHYFMDDQVAMWACQGSPMDGHEKVYQIAVGLSPGSFQSKAVFVQSNCLTLNNVGTEMYTHTGRLDLDLCKTGD